MAAHVNSENGMRCVVFAVNREKGCVTRTGFNTDVETKFLHDTAPAHTMHRTDAGSWLVCHLPVACSEPQDDISLAA